MRGVYYNRTNTCDRCKVEKLKPTKALREYDRKGNWTGKWLCHKCWKADYRLENGMSKSSRRTGGLDPNSNQAKGDLFEELTCRWRGVKNLNIENNSYNYAIDHSRDPELGIIQTRGELYDPIRMDWSQKWISDHEKDFDHIILYCANKYGNIIERIYIFPWEEVLRRTGVGISKNPSIRAWYENYRIDEKTLNYVNNIFQSIINENRNRCKITSKLIK